MSKLAQLLTRAQALCVRTNADAAQRDWATAQELPLASRRRKLRQLAVRYPLTIAAKNAWRDLALCWLVAGEPERATQALKMRRTLPFTSAAVRAEMLTQAAVAHSLACHRRAAQRHLAIIGQDHSQRTMRVLGEAVPGQARRARAVAHPTDQPDNVDLQRAYARALFTIGNYGAAIAAIKAALKRT